MSRIVAIFILVALFSLTLISPVAACSGYFNSPVNETLTQYDIVVTGSFVESDDRGINGIFQVAQVLQGKNVPEFLLVAQNNRPQEAKHHKCAEYQGYDTHPTRLLFLTRNPDGSYRPFTGYPWYIFPETDSRMDVWFGTTTDSTAYNLTLPELVERIVTLTGQSPEAPLKTGIYPAKLPALLTTQSGSHFLLPVDGGEPYLVDGAELARLIQPEGCSAPPCDATSRDGSNFASLYSPDDTTSTLNYRLAFRGDALLFSVTSDAIAVWAGNMLQIYTFPYNYVEAEKPSQVVNTITGNFQFVAGKAVWSNDGRMLAFTDERGLWLWDALTTGSTPRLLVSGQEGYPVARYFSANGRYLAVSTTGYHSVTRFNGTKLFWLDLVSYQRFPDGLISPDERTLLAFDTTAAEFTPVETPLTPVQWRTGGSYNFFPVRQMLWLADDRILFVGCYTENGDVTDDMTRCGVGGNGSAIPGYQFDYDAPGDALITLIDGTTITVNGEKRTIYLDSDIIRVDWLCPLFNYNTPPQPEMAAGG